MSSTHTPLPLSVDEDRQVSSSNTSHASPSSVQVPSGPQMILVDEPVMADEESFSILSPTSDYGRKAGTSSSSPSKAELTEQVEYTVPSSDTYYDPSQNLRTTSLSSSSSSSSPSTLDKAKAKPEVANDETAIKAERLGSFSASSTPTISSPHAGLNLRAAASSLSQWVSDKFSGITSPAVREEEAVVVEEEPMLVSPSSPYSSSTSSSSYPTPTSAEVRDETHHPHPTSAQGIADAASYKGRDLQNSAKDFKERIQSKASELYNAVSPSSSSSSFSSASDLLESAQDEGTVMAAKAQRDAHALRRSVASTGKDLTSSSSSSLWKDDAAENVESAKESASNAAGSVKEGAFHLTDKVMDAASSLYHTVAGGVSHASQVASEQAHDAKDAVEDAAARMKNQTELAAMRTQQSVHDAMDKTKAKAEELTEKTKEKAAEVKEKTKEKASDVKEATKESAANAKARLHDVTEPHEEVLIVEQPAGASASSRYPTPLASSTSTSPSLGARVSAEASSLFQRFKEGASALEQEAAKDVKILESEAHKLGAKIVHKNEDAAKIQENVHVGTNFRDPHLHPGLVSLPTHANERLQDKSNVFITDSHAAALDTAARVHDQEAAGCGATNEDSKGVLLKLHDVHNKLESSAEELRQVMVSKMATSPSVSSSSSTTSSTTPLVKMRDGNSPIENGPIPTLVDQNNPKNIENIRARTAPTTNVVPGTVLTQEEEELILLD